MAATRLERAREVQRETRVPRVSAIHCRVPEPDSQEQHMEPVIALNYMAIAVCVILGMALGFV